MPCHAVPCQVAKRRFKSPAWSLVQPTPTQRDVGLSSTSRFHPCIPPQAVLDARTPARGSLGRGRERMERARKGGRDGAAFLQIKASGLSHV